MSMFNYSKKIRIIYLASVYAANTLIHASSERLEDTDHTVHQQDTNFTNSWETLRAIYDWSTKIQILGMSKF